MTHATPWTASYPPTLRWDSEIPLRPVDQILDDAVARWPDQVAIDFMGRRFSYAELAQLVARAAKGLQALGVGPGVHVGLYLANTPHYMISFFAVLKAGGVVVNYSPLDAEKVLEHKIGDSQTDVLVTLDFQALYPQMDRLLASTRLKTLVVGTLGEMTAHSAAVTQQLRGAGQLSEVAFDARHVAFANLIDNDGAYTRHDIGDPRDALAGPTDGVGPVSAAPYGSAGILPISWAYVRLMGGAGLRRATEVAVLNANYVAARLREHYPVLYSGTDGLVAHECILDLRGITKDTGVSVDDVAKRLIDYGFHAPTMSFPVAGTLMVEPTESEDLAELDRFCDTMIQIRREIDEVGSGAVAAADSVLRGAPHTAEAIAGDWDHGYDRRTAAFPEGVDPTSKYWPPVRRIDGAYGDRHLVCSCPPPEAFEE